MLKKVFMIAVVGLIGVSVINETRAGDKFRAWVERMGKKFDKELTPEQELARIKKEVALLDKDIDKVKGDLAESNVNVRLLKGEVDELRAEIKDSDASVRNHGDVLKVASSSDRIQWGYRTVSYVDAKDLLQGEVKRHKDLKDRLKAREAALGSQEQTRELVEQQLQEMLKQKEELGVAVAEMEASIKLAKVEQIRSKHQNDGTRMAEIKRSMAELKKRVMIQREKLNIDTKVNRSPAEDKSVEQILAEMDGQPVKAKKIFGEDVKVLNTEVK
jgi:peptidoglycan hydrolase CwlO-like protein